MHGIPDEFRVPHKKFWSWRKSTPQLITGASWPFLRDHGPLAIIMEVRLAWLLGMPDLVRNHGGPTKLTFMNVEDPLQL